jgi:hypothetical protein
LPPAVIALTTLGITVELITTVLVPATLEHPPTVTIKLYAPALREVAPVIVGFCVEFVYEFTPVHA